VTPPRTKPKVWNGAADLKRFLVEIDSLEPWPGNPNQGDVELVSRSLARFGQVLPISVDGSRIVAGHTRVAAARSLGWTHIAAIPNQFANEEEARAYLVGDNATGRAGGFDEELLAAQLADLANFEGTGYSQEDAAELAERLAFLADPQFPEVEGVPALDARSPLPETFEVPLLLSREGRQDFARHVSILRREWGLETAAEAVVRAVREAAERT
jgi:ParB-like chromosome segregation protein Spo0J